MKNKTIVFQNKCLLNIQFEVDSILLYYYHFHSLISESEKQKIV